MLATRNLTEEQVRAGMLVSLPPETSKGLGKVESDEVKILIQLAREASDTAGNALMACAQHLYSIKGIVKKKGWTALCDSGSLGMGSKQAQMLALCHERLFLTGAVPASAVANVSITTMYLMASSDDKKRGEMVAALVEAGGSGFTEKEARAIKNKGKAKKASSAPVSDWIKSLPSDFQGKVTTINNKASQVEALKARVEELEAENSKLKARLQAA